MRLYGAGIILLHAMVCSGKILSTLQQFFYALYVSKAKTIFINLPSIPRRRGVNIDPY
jgi:hypothetical protein